MNKFKKLIALTILSLSALTAFATPSPKQIEKALAGQDFQAARGMVSEVLREHPNSARAHLMNAYILERSDHNIGAANEELKQVVRLDDKGDVKGSALFGKVVAEIEAQPAAPVKRVEPRKTPYSQESYQKAYQPPTSGGNAIVYILLGFGVVIVVGIALVTINRKDEVVVVRHSPVAQERYYPVDTTHNGVVTREIYDREQPVRSSVYVQPVPQQTFVAPQPQYLAQPQRQGMGMMGTAASVAGGVVAGELLMDAIRGNGHSHRHDSDSYDAPARETERYAPPAPRVDYEVKEASFSSGNDNNWTRDDSSSSSSASDSSWGDSSSGGGDNGGGGDW